MRLVTFDDGSGPRAGVLIAGEVVAVASIGAPSTQIRGLLEALDADGLAELARRAENEGERIALADVRLCAPVPDPQKIICLGLNYRDHAAETGQEIPTSPIWFAKFANSLIGSGKEIVLPAAHPTAVDYEAELAVVIGRRANRVDSAEALSCVAGAMPFNDVSARDLQFLTPQWTAGKAIDTFAPCGPALVTLDEIEDIQALGVRTRLNGEVVQEGTTAEQIFPVAEAIAWLSRTMTLLPGDIIATGTPAGVGASKGLFLHDGDTVEVEVDGLGSVSNPVRCA
ncbi:MAG TPA: fumarylacetoacetate hydrolase family protein [Solirubrobacteraceae bacterium]|jgi:2-keto-4-pentenoate hydratase/2-oxohepta-3-ene-1,7-dioic acid hydratase in catechol pathway|nr:fumarylacetoacetate hydrolase family protein [Solirubrobacteraceae bacterium]